MRAATILVRLASALLVIWLGMAAASAPNWLERLDLWVKAGPILLFMGIALYSLLFPSAFAEVVSRSSQRLSLGLLFTVSLGALLLFAFAANLSFGRVFGGWYFTEGRRYFWAMRADPVLKYRHPPTHTAEYQGVTVTTNERGYRNPRLEPKSDDRFRVLSLGDSVAFGWGAPQDEIYARHLEAAVQADRPVEVVNTGHGSYNTIQEANLLLAEGMAQKPDLITLLYIANDDENHVARVEHVRASSAAFLALSPLEEHGPLSDVPCLRKHAFNPPLLYAAHVLRRLRSVEALERVEEKAKAAKEIVCDAAVDARPVPSGHLGISDSLYAFRRIAWVAQANDIPVLLFYLPNLGGDPFFDRVACHLRAIGLEPRLVSYGPARLSPIDVHPNGDGHRMLGAQMAPHLERALRGRAPRGPDWAPVLPPELTGTSTVMIAGVRVTGRLERRFSPMHLSPVQGTELRLALSDAAPGIRRAAVRFRSDGLFGASSPPDGTEYVLEIGPGARVLRDLGRRDDASGRSLGGIHRWEETTSLEVEWLDERGVPLPTASATIVRLEIVDSG